MNEVITEKIDAKQQNIETLPPPFSEVQKEITGFIKQMRESKNLTQTDVANQIGITQNGYAKLERGDTKDLTISRLLSLSKVFNIELGDMLPNRQGKGMCYVGDNSNNVNGDSHNSNFYNNADNGLVIENEKLKLELEFHKKLYEQQVKQTKLLEEMVESLKSKQ